MRTKRIGLTLCIVLCSIVNISARAQYGVTNGEWRHFGGDPGNTKYSNLAEITRENFDDLAIAWRWTSISQGITKNDKTVRAGQFKVTPLMADGLVYVITAISQVAAIDAGTGKIVWQYDPESYKAGRPTGMGWQHRGLAYWTDGQDARILVASQDRKLIALDAKTGKPCPDFGEDGSVDLTKNLGRPINPRTMTCTAPPAIAGDTVIVGHIVGDGVVLKEGTPGHIRGYDVRTGRMKWIFHTIPQEGEFGVETWKNESWKYTGAANVWVMMAVDEELGYVYLPISTSTNDIYGGHRLGDNLFAESLVCLDAETGERVWHFQVVHHGLWDYDMAAAPNLLDIVVDGKKIKAVAQVGKQGFTFVFDRVTGEPVWPIEERPVPQTTVPGERTSPTQPFPTKPPPFERQGVTEDDLVDFTPEIKKEALEIAKGYTLGPLYGPPRTKDEGKPTINLPGDAGGANWHGAAVDPESAFLYIPSSTNPRAYALVKPDPSRSNLDFVHGRSLNVRGPKGFPLVKPPYSRITAIDLNAGDHAWMEPHGEGPRNHPAIKHLNLPPLGGGYTLGGAPLATKTLLFVTHGGRNMTSGESARQLAVYDKKSGEYLGAIPLPATPYGNPITYRHNGRQYLVVPIGGGAVYGGGGVTPELLAFALP